VSEVSRHHEVPPVTPFEKWLLVLAVLVALILILLCAGGRPSVSGPVRDERNLSMSDSTLSEGGITKAPALPDTGDLVTEEEVGSAIRVSPPSAFSVLEQVRKLHEQIGGEVVCETD
jgi:hypothetical protein